MFGGAASRFESAKGGGVPWVVVVSCGLDDEWGMFFKNGREGTVVTFQEFC